MGMAGIGLYWCIIEYLYENNGYLELEQIDLLAFELRVDKKTIEDLIDNYDLFKKNKKSFYSKSVLDRLERINEISRKNKENVAKRWKNKKDTTVLPNTYEKDTTVLPLKCKEKENKKKIKENKNKDIIITTTNNNNIYDYIEQNFGRTLSPVECEKISEWLSMYSSEIIEHAIKISVMNSKKTFSYVGGILKSWKGKNYNTLSEILEEEEKFRSKNTNAKVVELFDYDWLNEK